METFSAIFLFTSRYTHCGNWISKTNINFSQNFISLPLNNRHYLSIFIIYVWVCCKYEHKRTFICEYMTGKGRVRHIAIEGFFFVGKKPWYLTYNDKSYQKVFLRCTWQILVHHINAVVVRYQQRVSQVIFIAIFNSITTLISFRLE